MEENGKFFKTIRLKGRWHSDAYLNGDIAPRISKIFEEEFIDNEFYKRKGKVEIANEILLF